MLLLVGCDSLEESTNIQSEKGIVTIPPSQFTESPPSPLIQVELFMSEAPPLNTPINLTCTLTLISRYPGVENTTAQIILPDGVTLVSGNLTWEGDLKSGESLSFSPTIIFNEVGHYTIEAVTRHQIDNQHGWGDMDTLYLDIGVEQSQFGWPPEPVKVTVAESSSFPKVDLSISHPPTMNEPALVTCVLTSEIEMPNITAKILLSLGAELVSGNLEWRGDLKADVPVSFSAQIIFIQTGYNYIGWHVWQAGNEISWANPRNIELRIGEESSSFLELTPLPPSS